MVNKIINWLTRRPAILNWFRKLLENNHRGEKEVIARELPERQSQRILDLGCGTGVFSPWFGPGYVGIDIAEIYINYARRHYRDKEFQIMDASKLKFPAQFFDAIWVNGVLHHLNDDSVRQVVAEMKCVLKLGGKVVVMEDIPAQQIISRLVRSLDAGEYIRTPRDYRNLLQEKFLVQKEYPLRTGVCDYQVFILA